MLTLASLVRSQCGDIRGKRLPLLRGLTLIVVTCLCLSSQLLPQARRIKMRGKLYGNLMCKTCKAKTGKDSKLPSGQITSFV